jgi:RNA polymerase-binding transcription factor DksA
MTPQPTWTPDELAALHDRMVVERDVLRARVGDHQRSGPICGDAADHATLAVETELDDLAEARDRDLLAQVESILDRLDAGTYATCDHCGGPVERARQEAYPRATTCITCARGGGRGPAASSAGARHR